jgi:hypothetical protein
MNKEIKKILYFWFIYFIFWMIASMVFVKFREGLCVSPFNPSLCALPGVIEANKIMAMGPAYDLEIGGGPAAWHDPEIRIPGDWEPHEPPKPVDFTTPADAAAAAAAREAAAKRAAFDKAFEAAASRRKARRIYDGPTPEEQRAAARQRAAERQRRAADRYRSALLQRERSHATQQEYQWPWELGIILDENI